MHNTCIDVEVFCVSKGTDSRQNKVRLNEDICPSEINQCQYVLAVPSLSHFQSSEGQVKLLHYCNWKATTIKIHISLYLPYEKALFLKHKLFLVLL